MQPIIPSKDQQIATLWWLLTSKGYNKSFHSPGQRDIQYPVILWADDFCMALENPETRAVVYLRAMTLEDMLEKLIAFQVAERLE